MIVNVFSRETVATTSRRCESRSWTGGHVLYSCHHARCARWILWILPILGHPNMTRVLWGSKCNFLWHVMLRDFCTPAQASNDWCTLLRERFAMISLSSSSKSFRLHSDRFDIMSLIVWKVIAILKTLWYYCHNILIVSLFKTLINNRRARWMWWYRYLV